MGAISNTPEDSASALKPPTIPAAELCSFIALWTLCALLASAILCFQYIADYFAKNMGVGVPREWYEPGACLTNLSKTSAAAGWQCSLGCYDVIVAALADDKKSRLEDAYEISAPRVVGHFAENLRNTGSALHAK
jgi:hypothetical protein